MRTVGAYSGPDAKQPRKRRTQCSLVASASIARAASKPMPDGTPAPVPGQPPQQPQAPFGSTPVVAPTANRGHEAAGLQKLGIALQNLQELLPLVGAGSDVGQAVLDSLKKLSKYVPPGSMTPAAQRNQLEATAMKQGQNNQQMEMLKRMQMQQQGGGAQPPQAKAA